MNPSIYRRENISRFEFWAATTIFVFAVFFHITQAVSLSRDNEPPHLMGEQVPYHDYFFSVLARYIVLYLSFLLLNFKVAPQLVRKEALVKNIFLVLLVYAVLGLVYGVTDTYLKVYLFERFRNNDETYNFIFQRSFFYAAWLILLFGFYTAIKQVGYYLMEHAEKIQSKSSIINRDGLLAFMVWLICLFFLLVGGAEAEVIMGWIIVGPSAILLYSYSFYSLIPRCLGRRRPFLSYMTRVLIISVISVIPVGIIVMAVFESADAVAAFSMFNASVQVFITGPLSWILFKRQMKGNEEIHILKKELGQTHANFDFLRSQINPHFLFNALNTIYGTAIQEKAERTSEGIEKLGGMMRFMLQENMQEKIALSREIEYLNNYISLQRLRTDVNPNVVIHTAIEEPVNTVQISPMLLIPFVENAFKHGISFREPSYIKIALEMKENTLYFDVHNTKHMKQENDPEKNKTGIGLKNVKQRLQLQYPGRHELVIRETGKDYFVHLTMKLK